MTSLKQVFEAEASFDVVSLALVGYCLPRLSWLVKGRDRGPYLGDVQRLWLFVHPS